MKSKVALTKISVDWKENNVAFQLSTIAVCLLKKMLLLSFFSKIEREREK